MSEAYYTLSGDVNSDMVQRVFKAVSQMTDDGVTTAHVFLHSNGGFVSDGICLYNYLSNVPIKFVMYNGGAVVSIAVTLFLAGTRRIASEAARFMVHKSHASPPSGARPDELKIILDGLKADDQRTELILRKHVTLTPEHWAVHAMSDLHLSAAEALEVGLVHEVADFTPPAGYAIKNI
jgi:ATP-dependent Clp protease protease subunit